MGPYNSQYRFEVLGWRSLADFGGFLAEKIAIFRFFESVECKNDFFRFKLDLALILGNF